MQTSLRKQTGLTGIGLVLVLCLIGFFSLLILKIGPIYLEHLKIKRSLTALEEEAGLPSKSKHQVKRMLMDRMNINNVDIISNDDISVYKEGRSIKVQISYEVTENIIGNLDVLVYFDDTIEVGKN